jgi:hypothetical protein
MPPKLQRAEIAAMARGEPRGRCCCRSPR